jgi:tRNA(fMet)-specific endonuclease VapC
MKLLDTTVVIDIDRGGSEVLNKVRKLDREGTHAISAVTQYEFYWGIFRRYEKGSAKYEEAMAKAEMLFSRFHVLPVTSEIAIKAAEIRNVSCLSGKGSGYDGHLHCCNCDTA